MPVECLDCAHIIVAPGINAELFLLIDDLHSEEIQDSIADFHSCCQVQDFIIIVNAVV